MRNRKLKDLIELSSSVQLYIPEGNSEVEKRVYTFFSERFGGSTVFDALGCWTSPVDGLVREHVRIVKSYCTEDQLKRCIEEVINEAEVVKSLLHQEAVALEVNNKMYLV